MKNQQKAIAYYRVSTSWQGRSGLGLEAQQQSVQQFAKANNLHLINELIETKSGMRNGRLGLKAALAECMKADAVLLIATLDRISRRLSFIADLIESNVPFKVVSHPNADKFTLQVLGAVAEKEHDDISNRTSAALQAAKRRGVQLGIYGRTVQSKRNRKAADRFADDMVPVIARAMSKGATTVRAIVDTLNRLRVPTFRNHGQHWHIATVYRLLKRLSPF